METSEGVGMQVNDVVIFSPRQGETAAGKISRVWDKPADNPYVTIKHDGGTYVRFASACQLVKAVRATPTPEDRAAVLQEWARDAERAYGEYAARYMLTGRA